jgi:hypothetical protein
MADARDLSKLLGLYKQQTPASPEWYRLTGEIVSVLAEAAIGEPVPAAAAEGDDFTSMDDNRRRRKEDT